MKEWILALLLIAISQFSLNGVQPVQSTNFISPSNVKSTRANTRHALKDGDINSTKYATMTPKIHEGIWPEFCLQHLQNDPDGCSAWTQDEKRNVHLEFLVDGYSQAQIDRELIDSLGHLSYLIPTRNQGKKKSCNYAWCPTCCQTVIRGICCEEVENEEEDEDGNEVTSYMYFLVYKCGCTGVWWLDLDDLGKQERKIYNGWQFCKSPTVHHGYFDWHHQTYFRHLKNYLLYVEQNPDCSCYWPQVDTEAKTISDLAYTKLDGMFASPNMDKRLESFSPYLIKRSQHGFLSGLLTHAFLYSHYHEILLDFDQHCFEESSSCDYPLIHKQLMEVEEEVQKPFLELYNQCLQKHPHPKIYYERGMVLFHRGENLDSLEDIRKFISYAENHHYQELLTSDLYLKEGRLLSESLSYDEAIVSLTKALEKDPKNVDAYFERAIAYFETGDFSKALSDYLASGLHPKKVDPKKIGDLNYVKFGQGIVLGMVNGGQDSVTEFVPSLLACFRGISRGIWACVTSPVAVSQDMIDCANACLEFIKDTTVKDLLCKIVPELQECLKKWDQLDDYTKGRYIGYVIGKYGVDIFIGSGSIKAIQLYRNLRRANALMTLETASISPKFAQEVLEQCIREEKIRLELLKSGRLKIEWAKQNKHIPGEYNYITGRSIFEHTDPQRLIENFAGSGQRVNHVTPGKPGYKEIIDFKEHIGIWKSKDGKNALPTTRGTIHYSKEGCHIVPAEPKNC